MPPNATAIAGFLAALALTALCASEYRRSRRRRWVAFAVSVWLVEGLVMVRARAEDECWHRIELNPRFETSELVGMWMAGKSTLLIEGDGGFVEPDGTRGRWRAPTSELACLVTGASEWACVRRGDQLLLMWMPDADPDSWSCRGAFAKTSPP